MKTRKIGEKVKGDWRETLYLTEGHRKITRFEGFQAVVARPFGSQSRQVKRVKRWEVDFVMSRGK